MTKDNLILFEGKYYTKEIYDEIIYADAMVEQYDLLQLTKKITLNSFYGALLSMGFRWAVEERMGASTTYTGRAITTFMLDTTAELLTGVNAGIKKTFELVKSNGEYRIHNIYTADNEAIIYGDTDSVASDSVITTNKGDFKIEELFNLGTVIVKGDKEYSMIPGLKSLSYQNDSAELMDVRWLYRHRVTKERWKITLESGKSVIVTADHSIMVERDGQLIEVCACEVNRDSDICISIKD